MRFDDLNCLIRETAAPGCYGDSLAETARHSILRPGYPNDFTQFITTKGFLRHPLSPWREDDSSADQLLPLVLAINLSRETPWIDSWWRIPGTKTICPPGLWFAIRGKWGMVERLNQVQGWLLGLSFRIGDGFKIEKSQGKVQDYLNMICIHLFLTRMGEPTRLPREPSECLAAVRTYYLEGPDAEPNSEWIVDLYRSALGVESVIL